MWPVGTTLGHYVLGIAGLGLLREWWSQDDEAEARRERLLELAAAASGGDELLALELETPELDVVEGYTAWAPSYDGPNPLIEVDDAVCGPRLAELAEAFPGGRALDAGCGTGRKARQLVELGLDVIGCDVTPAMLDLARTLIPGAEFREGGFEALPIEDGSVDVAVSSLAVCHLSELDGAFREFARVMRPGAVLQISDPHPTLTLLGGQAFFQAEGRMPFVRNQGRPIAEYFAAATAAGLRVTRLEEVPMTQAVIDANPVGQLYPDIANAGLSDLPWLLVLEAEKPS